MEVRPFGLWPSSLSPDDLAASKRFRDLAWDSDGRTLVWLENRGPQGVLVCQQPGTAPRDLTTALNLFQLLLNKKHSHWTANIFACRT